MDMDDLISRQAAIDVLKRKQYNGNGYISRFYNAIIQHDIEAIEQLPSAQLKIIRCKDCKYWDTTWQNDYAPNYHYCPMIDGAHRNDFYCAYAERRTDG